MTQSIIEWTDEKIKNFIETLPEWDEINYRPKTKMPNCPVCGEDELGMLSEYRNVYCYACGFEYYPIYNRCYLQLSEYLRSSFT